MPRSSTRNTGFSVLSAIACGRNTRADWFRFVFKYSYLLQIRGYDKLREIGERDYSVFSSFAQESYFHQKFVEPSKWTRLGNWWDRKGVNELDLVAENELDGRLIVAEVKRDYAHIDLGVVRAKLEIFRKTARNRTKAQARVQSPLARRHVRTVRKDGEMKELLIVGTGYCIDTRDVLYF